MKYRLINQNYSSNYIENILAEKGIDGEILLNPTKEFLQSPEYLNNIDEENVELEIQAKEVTK